MNRFAFLSILFALTFCQIGLGQSENAKLRIFILAGQSNMEGKGSVETMEHQLNDAAKKNRFEHLKTEAGYLVRNDVFITYLGNHGIRNGGLTVGYGTSKKDDQRLFGPELGFGWVTGDHYQEPILIIKTAWGGKSIDRDFRPPSRGYPESIKDRLANVQKKEPEYTLEQCQQEYGAFYRKMIEHVNNVTSDLPTYAPGYKNQGFEIAGLVWFQGFNDQFAPTSVEDYEDNMVAFIKDVRKDLKSPKMKFVIGAMGHQGKEQKGKVKQIADAQVAAANHSEFSDGSVVAIRTAQFWDEEAQEAFNKYWADRPNRDVEKWKTFGNDRPYHYLGSPVFFLKVGEAFGQEMIKLAN